MGREPGGGGRGVAWRALRKGTAAATVCGLTRRWRATVAAAGGPSL